MALLVFSHLKTPSLKPYPSLLPRPNPNSNPNPIAFSSSSLLTPRRGSSPSSFGFSCSRYQPPRPSFPVQCSSGHGEYKSEHELVSLPRPRDIPWSKDLANSVHLIGIVGAPVQIKHLSSGKALAWTRIGVKKSATETTWISLTFWDDLANVAFQHLEKGQQVYVSGRLVCDVVQEQAYYKVVVQQLKFVERTIPMVSSYDSVASDVQNNQFQLIRKRYALKWTALLRMHALEWRKPCTVISLKTWPCELCHISDLGHDMESIKWLWLGLLPHPVREIRMPTAHTGGTAERADIYEHLSSGCSPERSRLLAAPLEKGIHWTREY
ncbi:protein OSB1, mitochondrial-like isoform X1 [Canna indica]|uniref:Protein OSB1, mitochondrial-like isoform X1 n=1 Tax=Canna indica TaxID=4628 RepID=A0AAQ3JMT5_9LILI|nr:protein OSB1, mitochondrial-like isoform X1 [Canna indica]